MYSRYVPITADVSVLLPVNSADLVQARSHGFRFKTFGKSRRVSSDIMVESSTELLVEHLKRSG